METMQWSEVSTTATSPNGRSNDLGGLGLGTDGSSNGSLGAPTIKNHSVTYFNDHLYCFGGYDGRRNHNLLLLYNIREHRWIRPHNVDDDFSRSATTNTIGGTPSIGNSNTTTTASRCVSDAEIEEDDDSDSDIPDAERDEEPRRLEEEEDNTGTPNHNEASGSDSEQQQEVIGEDPVPQHQQQPSYTNHYSNNNNNNNVSPRSSNNNNESNDQEGFYPSSINNEESRFAYTVTGNPPPGRNGHSATLATDDDDDDDDNNVTGRIIILGGWLGQGPLAASDMHVLEIARGGKRLRWYQPPIKGTPPGPCNMHSADYVKARKEVFVFRGGNGREYLNDVHALHVPTMTWRKVETTGESPQQRANHSSCILEETGEIFIFGGWNGTNRLNDIHIFDTKTCNWSCPKVGGVLPHPRAGMTLTALRGRLYLFGGSGTSSKCFQDLQILDREEMAWLDVTQYESIPHGNGNSSGNNNHHHHRHPSQMHSSAHYHQQNHFALPPSQHYYVHSHQHQHYQPHHQHPFVQHPDNGFFPSNPQWNFGGHQPYYDYAGGHHHHPYHHTASTGSRSVSTNQSGMNSPGRFSGTGMSSNYRQHSDNDDDTDMDHHRRHHRPGSFTSSRADWTSRELAATPRSMGTGVIASPNPNDEDTTPTILLHGLRVPGSRAGHTATAVNRKIYIFGGSCGSDYLNDFYVLDTDPPPRATVNEPTSSHLIKRRLPHFFNDEEFSDVTFLVQGRRVYGHKMVLAIVSDCFRAMFTAGFRESSSSEIEITGCSYEAFLAVMEYAYTGATPHMGMLCSPMSTSSGDCSRRCRLNEIVDVLELADRFFLDHLKQVCETQLQSSVRADTADYLLQVAQKTNAMQLQAICEHFLRNRDSE